MGAQTYTANVVGGFIAIVRQTASGTLQNISISDVSPSNTSSFPVINAIINSPSGYFPTQVIVTASENAQPITQTYTAQNTSFSIDFSGVSQVDPSTSNIDFNVTYALIANASTPQVSIGTPSVSIGTPSVSIGTPQVSVGSGGGNVSVGSSIGGGDGALQELANLRAETGLFGSLTEAELLEMRADVVKQIKAVMSGELVVSVTIAGKQVTKKLPELSELRELLAETNNQLKLIDPQAYGKKRRRFGFDHRHRRV
jgi:hypothetical protein